MGGFVRLFRGIKVVAASTPHCCAHRRLSHSSRSAPFTIATVIAGLAELAAGALALQAVLNVHSSPRWRLSAPPGCWCAWPAWASNYTFMACLAALTLWNLERTDHIEVIERNLREKVIAPDFRAPMFDGRLSLARLSALQGRYDEAVEWFAKARAVLEEQGARPLRATVDYDEALMYHRRGEKGDPSTWLRASKEQAAPLLDAALAQFRELGMTGWTKRAEELRSSW